MGQGKQEPPESQLLRAAPYGCLLASIVLVVLVDPPQKLVAFLGSVVWAKIALALIVFLGLIIVLSLLGLSDGKITLPFGLGVDKSSNSSAEVRGLVALGEQLATLQAAEAKRFDRIEELARLQEETATRLDDVERRIREDDPTMAGGN